jgi:hypothetical protein
LLVKVRCSIILLALVTVLGIAGVKLFEARSHRLRLDGVYCASDQRDVGGDLYLRFYRDGTALSHIRGYGPLEQEVMEMYRGGHWVQQGRYTVEDGTVSISLEGYARLEGEAAHLPPGVLPPRHTYYLFGELHSDRIEVTSSYGRGEYKFIKVPLPNET